jgi:hypothetical protein
MSQYKRLHKGATGLTHCFLQLLCGKAMAFEKSNPSSRLRMKNRTKAEMLTGCGGYVCMHCIQLDARVQ